MAGSRFERKQEEAESTDKYFFNLALRGNAIVQEVALHMVDIADTLEETFPEYKKGSTKANKAQNSNFYTLRKDLRTTINLTAAHILKNKHSKEDEEVIAKCTEALEKPYGSYDLRVITAAAHGYYDLLVKKGIIAIVSGWEDTTAESRMRKF